LKEISGYKTRKKIKAKLLIQHCGGVDLFHDFFAFLCPAKEIIVLAHGR